MKIAVALLFALLYAVYEEVNGTERVIWLNGETGVHAEHPNKCWSSTLNREFNKGEELNDQARCEIIRCGQNLRFQRRVYVTTSLNF